MILQVGPDAPVLIRAGAAAILYLHIGGGFASLASGAVALLARKGERLHRAAGNVFFAAMMLVAVIGAVVSPFLPQRIASVAGGLAFYLVVTAWLTVRRPEGRVGRLEVAAAVFAVAVALGGATLGAMAQVSPDGELDGLPYAPAYVFAAFAALGAACDLKVIRAGGISGRRRIARHLWRMCVALLIATASFVGQPKAFPPEWRGSPWLFAPIVVVLALSIFWLALARFTRAFEPARGLRRLVMLHPLHLNPDAPAWVVAASWPVLMVHITAGLIALMSGAAALAAPKGERLHRGAGGVFFVAMLVMLSLGGAIAVVGPAWPTAIGAVFGVYLVATAWMAARRPEGRVGRFETIAMAVALAVGATELALGVMGATSASGRLGRLPWQPAIILAVVAAIAVFADLRVIRRGVYGAQRVARHLWRMCTALFIASGSFFLGQQKVMPEAIHGSPVLIGLALAPLVLMIFWLFRVRSAKAFGSRRPSQAARI